MTDKASFKVMSDSTQEDWNIIIGEQLKFMSGLADRVLDHMKLLDADYGGFAVDRLQHCLQTAELAAEDGQDDEYVVCALLHDIGDTLGSTNHADVGAAILKPFVSEENHWMVQHHGIFQGYNFFHYIGMDRNLRDQFRGSPNFDRTEEFIEKYDNRAFDYDKPKLSLDTFAPIVRSVFATPKNSPYQKALE